MKGRVMQKLFPRPRSRTFSSTANPQSTRQPQDNPLNASCFTHAIKSCTRNTGVIYLRAANNHPRFSESG